MKKQRFWRRPQAVFLSAALALGVGGVGFASASLAGYVNSPLALKLASADEGPSRTGFAPVVKKVLPAVVNVSSSKASKIPTEFFGQTPDMPDDPLFGQFFGNGNGSNRQFNTNTQGVVVTNVSPSSEAAEAGLQKGDVIQQVNRQSVRNTSDFDRAVRSSKEEPLLLVNRNGSTMFLAV